MLNCKQISHLVSESLDKELPFWTRMEVRMHLMMCGLCSKFRKTMLRVDREVKQLAESVEHNANDTDANDTDANGTDAKLSNSARDRIQRTINSAR